MDLPSPKEEEVTNALSAIKPGYKVVLKNAQPVISVAPKCTWYAEALRYYGKCNARARIATE